MSDVKKLAETLKSEKAKASFAELTQQEVRTEVAWFASQMEYKLRCNDHKLHWHALDPNTLLKEVGIEVQELKEAVNQEGLSVFTMRDPTVDALENLIFECADVANYLMMIADHAHRLKPHAKSEYGKVKEVLEK